MILARDYHHDQSGGWVVKAAAPDTERIQSADVEAATSEPTCNQYLGTPETP